MDAKLEKEINEQLKAEEEFLARMEAKMEERLERRRQRTIEELERREKELREERMAQNIKNVDKSLNEKTKKPSIIKKYNNLQETMRNESENSSKI